MLSFFKEIKCVKNIVYWMCILALITSIPEAGVQDLLANYSFDVLHMCKEGNSTNFVTIGTIILIKAKYSININLCCRSSF